MREWRERLLVRLEGPSPPGVLDFAALVALVRGDQPSVASSSVRRFLGDLERTGVLARAAHGVWLNMRARPVPAWAEALHAVRTGAVVSLHTVLGDAGVTNNFTGHVYGVVPFGSGSGPNGGTFALGRTVAHVHGIPERLLADGPEGDRLQPFQRYPRATAEAALCHWIYLASSRKSALGEPDPQCDVSRLDMDRLGRLAGRFGVAGEMQAWLERVRAREEDDDENGWTPGLG